LPYKVSSVVDLRFDLDEAVYTRPGGCRWVLKIECSHGVLLEMNRECELRNQTGLRPASARTIFLMRL
jgi:hypothetical protein